MSTKEALTVAAGSDPARRDTREGFGNILSKMMASDSGISSSGSLVFHPPIGAGIETTFELSAFVKNSPSVAG